MADTDRAEEAMLVVMNLLQIGVYLHRVGSRVTGELGLKHQQFVVLNEIVTKGEINQTQLVGEILYEKSNISKIVKKLKTLDLIVVSSSPEDERMTMLNATSKGEVVWRRCLEKLNKWNTNWIKPLSKKEVSRAIQIVERLNKLTDEG